jgi:hypothetical protein
MAFSVGGLLLGIINHRHRGVSVAVPALVQKLYIALVVLIAVYMVVALIFGLPSWAGTVKHRLPMVLRPSPLRHVRLGRHRSFGAIMTDHEQALKAARDSLRNVVSIRDFLLAVQVGSETAAATRRSATPARCTAATPSLSIQGGEHGDERQRRCDHQHGLFHGYSSRQYFRSCSERAGDRNVSALRRSVTPRRARRPWQPSRKAGGGSEAFLILPAKQAKIDGL